MKTYKIIKVEWNPDRKLPSVFMDRLGEQMAEAVKVVISDGFHPDSFLRIDVPGVASLMVAGHQDP